MWCGVVPPCVTHGEGLDSTSGIRPCILLYSLSILHHSVSSSLVCIALCAQVATVVCSVFPNIVHIFSLGANTLMIQFASCAFLCVACLMSWMWLSKSSCVDAGGVQCVGWALCDGSHLVLLGANKWLDDTLSLGGKSTFSSDKIVT